MKYRKSKDGRVQRKNFVVQFSVTNGKEKLVSITHRVHPFPFRTRKLSCAVPKILGWRRPGKRGRCQHPARGSRERKEEHIRNLLNTRGCSSVGRAPALQAGGHGFESHHLHQLFRERRSGQGGMRNTGKRKRAHSSAG